MAAIGYVILVDLDALIDLFSFATWIFYGLCFLVIIWQRFRPSIVEKPFKVQLTE